MIIILSFRVGIFKNKTIDHGVLETCAIMSMKVTHKTDHIPLIHHSTMPGALSFFFFFFFYGDLKEKYHIRRNTNCEKRRSLYVKSMLLFDLPKFMVSRARTTKK